MTPFIRPFALICVLLLGACSNGTPFNDANTVALNNQPGGFVDGETDGADPASDPASPAFFQQRVGDRVLFPVDQSSLFVEAQSILSAQAQWLILNTDYQAVIEGHADEQGTTQYNLALGARRAASVRDYLVSQGVPDARLRTVTYGKERPAELCAEERCYSQNRRAVTVISIGTLG